MNYSLINRYRINLRLESMPEKNEISLVFAILLLFLVWDLSHAL